MDDMRVEYETERGGDRRYSRVGKSQERHTSQSSSPESGSHRKHSAHMTEEKKRDSSSSHLKRACKRLRSRSSSGDFRAKHKSRKERYGPRSKNRSKDVKKRKRDDSSSERSDSECARKHRLTKLKQKYGEMKRRHKKQEQLYDYSSSGCTSDSDSSLDSYSADSSPVQHKKKSKRSAKTSHKLYKKKKKKHKMKSRRKKSGKTKSGKVRSSAETGFEGPHKQHHSPKQVPETQVQPTVLPISGKTAKARGPMTKEEWEKQQSVVRRVYDPDTGRHRLVKGDGEIIEEIVSREQQKAINKQATLGDGLSFQAVLSKFQ